MPKKYLPYASCWLDVSIPMRLIANSAQPAISNMQLTRLYELIVLWDSFCVVSRSPHLLLCIDFSMDLLYGKSTRARNQSFAERRKEIIARTKWIKSDYLSTEMYPLFLFSFIWIPSSPWLFSFVGRINSTHVCQHFWECIGDYSATILGNSTISHPDAASAGIYPFPSSKCLKWNSFMQSLCECGSWNNCACKWGTEREW